MIDLTMNSNWHKPEYRWRREISESYNRKWICQHKLKYGQVVGLDEIGVEACEHVDASPFQVVWFKNVDRLMDMLPAWFEPEKYQFIDAGCGSGLSTLYCYDTYPFSRFVGFDFSKKMVDYANENLLIYSSQYEISRNIEFLVRDAKEFKVLNYPSFVFMYNPFGFSTAKKFLEKNHQHLIDSESVLAISNDVWINKLFDMGGYKKILRDDFNNLSLVFY